MECGCLVGCHYGEEEAAPGCLHWLEMIGAAIARLFDIRWRHGCLEEGEGQRLMVVASCFHRPWLARVRHREGERGVAQWCFSGGNSLDFFHRKSGSSGNIVFDRLFLFFITLFSYSFLLNFLLCFCSLCGVCVFWIVPMSAWCSV